ncbi:MAG: hypothetical protein EAZ81_03680 [Verrucomicrobia bacterium]|nr:MAG: hypothetical protein EAZ81_03680 [Verrucomicrobiota bacterium]
MRIYFDENFSHRIVSGMSEFQKAKPSEGISVIWTPDEFGKGAKDEEWSIVLTQDINIHRTRAQWEMCQQNKIGIFFFKPPRAGWSHWVIVREVVNRWEEIKLLAKQKRPFGFVIEQRKKKIVPL